MRETILEAMTEAAKSTGANLNDDIVDGSILLDVGLDSLGYAVLVSLLEDKLGFDPFSELDKPYYPKTLGELIAFYGRGR